MPAWFRLWVCRGLIGAFLLNFAVPFAEAKPQPFFSKKSIHLSAPRPVYSSSFVSNLKSLKSLNDPALNKQIPAILDVVKNRLFFFQPFIVGGKKYVAGMLRTGSVEYFLMEFTRQ